MELRDKVPHALRNRFMKERVPVSKYASSFAFWNAEHGWNSGTNAKLRAGEEYTVRELLYALMLPSGNDAAIALAEFFGPFLEPSATARAAEVCAPPPAGPEGAPHVWPHEHPISRFVAEMNRCVSRLGLFCPATPSTCLVSPHGMANDANLSCAADIVAFTAAAMRYTFFQKVWPPASVYHCLDGHIIV
ncbi:beta-lactamase/transpeptidase-like protein [Baffinella frigidus]|nr:beta-lactamase/transpeptidase-like protein [Cryptophyta sp. CCMP2293]